MSEEQIAHFGRLKEELRKRVEERLSIRKEFVDWSLNDISDFRTDLEACCQSSISEKWFYTHLKNDSEKLPRIDTLNLLSQYLGYKNWDGFIDENSTSAKPKRAKFSPWFIIILSVVIVSAGIAILFNRSNEEVHLRFVDAYTQEEVDQSTLTLHGRKGVTIAMKEGTVDNSALDTLWVDGAYYKSRSIPLNGSADTLVIRMFPDDYAMMLNFFSRSTTEDWQRRREQLQAAIHPDAKIFQSHPKLSGIELLNREEFIFRLTLPIDRLKNLEIQDIVYEDDQIYRLRFTQNMEEDEN